MTWADAVPNLLIGLREGLEAGLVVSILLAALTKANGELGQTGGELGTANDGLGENSRRRISPAAIWLGVVGAVSVAVSFAAVLTYSTTALSSAAQEGVGGSLSVLAVVLVTAMVFWMRRTARNLTAHLRGEVSRAVAIGAGALTVTAFLAVGREGLETTLFLWTAAKASGSTAAPLAGAAVGLAIAVVLCWLLYRRALRINLGVFFNRTAYALIVIAAGVLAYGLGDLQDAGWLPGQRWIAFDLTAHIDPGSWWVSIISGVTELSPKMTVLQVVAWVVYLVVTVLAFRYASVSEPAPATAGQDEQSAIVTRWEGWSARRPGRVGTVMIVVPAVVAAGVIALIPAASASSTTEVTVTAKSCAQEWDSGHTGTQTFDVDNKSHQAGEINLDNTSGAVVAEIETLGPATTAAMTATLGPGQYTFVCLMSKSTTRGKQVQISGSAQSAPAAVKPVTLADITAPNKLYQRYAAEILVTLAADVQNLHDALDSGNLPASKAAWLTAQLDWERVGASYDSFGDEGGAVDGLPDGLPLGVKDPGFVGLHRIEYGLYNGQSPQSLVPAVQVLAKNVKTVQAKLRTDDEAGDPTNLPLRVHEILEDAMRDHLSGIDNEGSDMAYAMTYADVQVTRVVLTEVAPLVQQRRPGLVATITAQLNALQSALLATRQHGQWQPMSAASLTQRQRVNAATGAVLESLSIEPDLLEVPPTH